MESLFDALEMTVPELPRKATLAERAAAFDDANPQVYRLLRELALDLVHRGHRVIGIGMLFEVVRWQHAMRTTDDTGYKLNNSYRAHYARRLMKDEPELQGVFNLRRVHGSPMKLVNTKAH